MRKTHAKPQVHCYTTEKVVARTDQNLDTNLSTLSTFSRSIADISGFNRSFDTPFGQNQDKCPTETHTQRPSVAVRNCLMDMKTDAN